MATLGKLALDGLRQGVGPCRLDHVVVEHNIRSMPPLAGLAIAAERDKTGVAALRDLRVFTLCRWRVRSTTPAISGPAR